VRAGGGIAQFHSAEADGVGVSIVVAAK
jgi:hypothetical protein